MADFTNAPTLTPTATPTPGLSAAAANLVPVQITVENAAPALLAVNRPMMMEATPAEIVGARSLTLATVLGELKVAMQANAAQQIPQDLLRELMSLIETKRTLTLSLQSGSVGTPGLLLVPITQNTTKPAPTPPQQTTAALTTPPQALPSAPQAAPRALPLPPAQSGMVVTVLPLPPVPHSVASPTATSPTPPPMSARITEQSAAPTNAPDIQQTREPESILLSRANKLYSHAPTAMPIPPMEESAPPPATLAGSPSAQLAASPTQTPAPAANAVPTAIPAAPAVVGYLASLYRTLVGTPQAQTAPQIPPNTITPPAPTPPQPTANVSSIPAPLTTATEQNKSPAPEPTTAQSVTPQTLAKPSAPQPSPQSAASPAPATATPSPPPVAQSEPAPAPVALPIGKDVPLRIVSVQPPLAGGAPASPPPLQPGQFTATIVAQTHDGRLLAQAGDNILYVRNEITAPIGATLILQSAAPGDAGIDLPKVQPAAYSALPDILNILQQMDVLTAPRLIASLPQANDGLAGALLQIFGSYKSADPAAWLGRPVAETLAHIGQAELLRSLSREMKEQTRAGSDPVVGDWRSYPVPLYNAGAFHTLTLHVHNDRDKSSDREHEGTRGKTRFLIDMRLSRLGDLQLDGFVQPKKIDMILRSEHSLPDGLHAELRGAYGKAMGAVGFAGTLNFQIGRQHWVRVTGDTRGGIVT